MSIHFHVGMRVVCIDPDDEPEPNPLYGEVYTISHIYCRDDDVMIDLVELPNPGNDNWARGYFATAFRPVQHRTTSIEIFRRMLIPSGVDA